MEEIIKTEMLTKIYNPLSQNPKLALNQISLSIKVNLFVLWELLVQEKPHC